MMLLAEMLSSSKLVSLGLKKEKKICLDEPIYVNVDYLGSFADCLGGRPVM